VGFGQAFTASGGTIDRAADGISDLVKNIGDAARGSKELQNAFGSVGVSLTDLGTLSERDILRKTIAGLAAIPDSARRTSTAMQIMGESVKGVDLQRLNRDLDGFTQRAGPNADAIKAAADAQKNFAQASQNVQVELLAALKPISELAASITVATGAVKTFVAVAVDIATVVAAFFAVSKGFSLLKSLFGGLTTAATSVKQAVSGLAVTFGSLKTQVKAVWREGAITDKTYAGLAKRFNALKTEVPLLAQGLGFLTAAAVGAYKVVSSLFKAEEDPAANQSAAETKRLQAYQDRAQAAIDLKDRIVNAHAEEKKGINDSIRGMQTASAEMQKRITLQTSLLRANEETRFAVETTQEAEQNYLKAIEPMLAKMQAIRAQGNKATSTDIELLPVLQEGIAKVTKEFEAQVPAIQAVIKSRVQEMQVAKELELASARLTKQAEDRAASESAVRDIIINGQQRINDAYNQAALVGLPAMKAQLVQIAKEEENIALAAKRRVAEQMGDDTAGLTEAIARINAASAVITQRRQEAAEAIYQEQNSFTAGWSRAFTEYAATATNAATQAQNIFSTVTKSIEDSFVNFAKTGKLSVKDLFKSIAETILRSQIQSLLARTFGGGGGGGSFLGNLFSAFLGGGRAAGGPVSAGRAYTVGESGPETFVPAGAGTIVPGTGATNITYNINAVDASSFRSMIAQDPEFLFAVTEQGRRRQPGQRR
jgi:lambda family phage tail tape measure protein